VNTALISLIIGQVVLVSVLSAFNPPLAQGVFRKIEQRASVLAARRGMCILALFMLTVVLRLALLPIFEYPRPYVHDEFAYLTQADMFTHGKLAFPPHPMSRYFETFYLSYSPTYHAMYPPAQATVLAIGQILGNPWIGVLLSTAAMVAAATWMLQGWFPARWAFLGGVVVLLQFGVLSYWMNSYWGGSVAALSSCLILGALPRIYRGNNLPSVPILCVALFILANSRPLEGFISCLPVAAFLLIRFARNRSRQYALQVLVPVGGALVAIVGFTFYYNWRLTGNPATLPHAVYYEQVMRVPMFLWGKIAPLRTFDNPQFNYFYNFWLLDQFNGTLPSALSVEEAKISAFASFFIGPWLTVPLLAIPWVLRDRRIRLPLIQIIISFLGLLAVTWFHPHYAAPIFGGLILVIVQSLRHLRCWSLYNRPIGLTITRLAMTMLVFGFLMRIGIFALTHSGGICTTCLYDWDRARITAELRAIPGKHLVIVRYTPDHNVSREWVYNPAAIDESQIIWAREVSELAQAPLLKYYPNRRVWLAEPDTTPPQLSPYTLDVHDAPPKQ
jgi:hypothetical protein